MGQPLFLNGGVFSALRADGRVEAKGKSGKGTPPLAKANDTRLLPVGIGRI